MPDDTLISLREASTLSAEHAGRTISTRNLRAHIRAARAGTASEPAFPEPVEDERWSRTAVVAWLTAHRTPSRDEVRAHRRHIIQADEAHDEPALRRAVGAARDAGLSWAQIGDPLGISRQAAHVRFSRHLTS
ncbi:hypothetical protein GS504_01110 [Rhodococcus hoagii]|nr:hypothetical protein [Prescottella equi]